ncbi:MAG: plasmid mobilization relaxosome protein MobC [Pseudomonadota bacterium]
MLALKQSIGELAAIGRNINQIARTTNQGGRLPESTQHEFLATLRICQALRDHTKALLKANLTSWNSGYGEGT